MKRGGRTAVRRMVEDSPRRGIVWAVGGGPVLMFTMGGYPMEGDAGVHGKEIGNGVPEPRGGGSRRGAACVDLVKRGEPLPLSPKATSEFLTSACDGGVVEACPH